MELSQIKNPAIIRVWDLVKIRGLQLKLESLIPGHSFYKKNVSLSSNLQ